MFENKMKPFTETPCGKPDNEKPSIVKSYLNSPFNFLAIYWLKRRDTDNNWPKKKRDTNNNCTNH